MLDREVFSCIPFFLFRSFLSFCLCEGHLSLLARKLWNWGLNSGIQNCSFPNTSIVYRLYLFCNICRIWFLTVASVLNPFWPIRLVFCFRDVRSHHLSNVFAEFMMLRWFPEDFWEAKQCEAQRGTVKSSFWFSRTRIITLLQCNVIETHLS